MKRILIVDDDPEVRKMLRIMLEREGYGVLTANNGEEGIEQFRTVGVDLVVTDIVMPDKEGLETIITMKKQAPAIPIIAISGGGRVRPDDYLALAEGLGATRSLTKPVEKAVLLGAVRDLIGTP